MNRSILIITKFHKPIVSAEWLYQNIDATNLIILDATIPKVSDTASVTSDLCIPNARFFDLKNKFCDTTAHFPNTFPNIEQFENETQKIGINHDSFIVVYDDKGIYSSPRVWYLFKAYGFHNIAVLDGGLPSWMEGYYPISKKSGYSGVKGNFTAKLQKGHFTFFDEIKKHKSSDTLIIDARSRARFNGVQKEPREGLRSGTIPNSINLPFTEVLFSGKMKSETELIELFNDINTNCKSLIFTCGSGITACVLALAAELAGFKNKSVYDGSWTEWGTLTIE